MSGRKTTYIDQRRQREAVELERLARHRQAIEQARRQAEALVADPAVQGFLAPTERQAMQRHLDLLGRIRAGDMADAPSAEARAAEELRRISGLLEPARQRSRLAEQAERLCGRLGAEPREAALRPRHDRLRQGLAALLARLADPTDGGVSDADVALPSALEAEHRTLLALDAGVAEVRRFCDELRRRASWADSFVAEAQRQLQQRLDHADTLTAGELERTRQAIFKAAEAAFEQHLAHENSTRQRVVETDALRRAANRALYLTLCDEVAALDNETRRLCPGALSQIEQRLTRLRAALDAEQAGFDGDVIALRGMLTELPAQQQQAIAEAQARQERHRNAQVELEATLGALTAGLDETEIGDAARRHAELRLAKLGRSLAAIAARIGDPGLEPAIAELRAALNDFAQGQQRKGIADQIRGLLLAADAIGRIKLDTASRERLQVGLSDHVEVRARLGDTGEALQLVILQSEDGRLELSKLSDDPDAGCTLFTDIARILEDVVGQPLAIVDEYQERVEVVDDEDARRRREGLAAKALDF